MKRYKTNTRDTCWNDSLACLLGVSPKRVPNFVKLYNYAYMAKTRDWLAENFNKGMVFIPARAFMETGRTCQNSPIGPTGFSIVIFTMVDARKRHAAIAFNGGVVWDNGDSREEEYDTIAGYYVIYDLQAPQAKWIRKKTIKVKKAVKKKTVTRKKTK